jgi:Bromodomain extra-terminal - transcription regulation/Bromodomain
VAPARGRTTIAALYWYWYCIGSSGSSNRTYQNKGACPLIVSWLSLLRANLMLDNDEIQSTNSKNATKISVEAKGKAMKMNGGTVNGSEETAAGKPVDAADGKRAESMEVDDSADEDDDDENSEEMRDSGGAAATKNGIMKKTNFNVTDSVLPSASASDAGDMDDDEETTKDESMEMSHKVTDYTSQSHAGGNKRGEASGTGASASTSAETTAGTPPPPVLRGTLSYNMELRRHLIRGMWNYENSSTFPPQRFELLRNLEPNEDPTVLPIDGEFHGSFSLAYFHTTSKGKQKERSKVIPESGVNIKFTKILGEEKFKVDGTGTNQFGIFHINGDATPSPHDDGQYNIVLRKRYEPSSVPAPVAVETDAGKMKKKRKMDSFTSASAVDEVLDDGPLPPPSESYEKNVVCLRGKLYKEESEELGSSVVYRIDGMWSSGLDLVLSDPQNVRGFCNRFEYEHKSSIPSTSFPVSGRYSGWFDLNVEDGTKKKIVEKDITLRFRKNNVGHYNVEGKGSNAFGKYSITGTLAEDNVITIFRHFQIKKSKTSRPVTSAPPPINTPGQSRRPSLAAAPEPQLKIDEVSVPPGEEPMEAFKLPAQGTYSAVSRGILRVNDDGSLSCQGKWAVTREHFTNGQTSNFTFRLEANFAAEALKKSGGREFPLDSEMYKGSFQLKKGGARYQTVIDQQIVMKFRKNTVGTYNVYGKGVNAIGIFNLTGTLIMSGKSGGQVEVYRMYPPELLAAPSTAPAKVPPSVQTGTESSDDPSGIPDFPPSEGLSRRESTRLVKMPSRLEDDDPDSMLQRIMDKCNTILRFMREKDVERGAFFSEPVDPVALGIPTYHQIIKEPMDLRTLARKMEAKEVDSPEEFARLARLVFENAIKFNIEPTHSVHQAARNLLILFNQKFRDIERMIQNLRKTERGDDGKKKKRKRVDEMISLKRRRLDEAQDMAAAHSSSMAALAGAVPRDPNANVSRDEFSLLLQTITNMQQQIVQTYTVLAELSSDEPGSGAVQPPLESTMSSIPPSDVSVASYTEPVRPVKKRQERVEKPMIEEDARPLSFQEQELLTETINELPEEQLHGVIQIIREAAKLSGEEEEIDLEIDQLDAITQRKLLRHVTKVRLRIAAAFVPQVRTLLTNVAVLSSSSSQRARRNRGESRSRLLYPQAQKRQQPPSRRRKRRLLRRKRIRTLFLPLEVLTIVIVTQRGESPSRRIRQMTLALAWVGMMMKVTMTTIFRMVPLQLLGQFLILMHLRTTTLRRTMDGPALERRLPSPRSANKTRRSAKKR